jgi:Fe-S-cluster containining protein
VNRHDLAALRAIYDEVDATLAGWSCPASADCCHFARTGREPYLWPNEWALLEESLAARGSGRGAGRRGLPIVDEERTCPLLDGSGRCTVYAARPFGCRTYFCERAEGPAKKRPRERLAELGRRLAALAERAEPSGEGPRPLSRWLETRAKKRKP